MPDASTILANKIGVMTERIRSGNFWPFSEPVITCVSAGVFALAGVAALVALALALIWPSSALAVSHYWGRHPDKERLVVVFDETIPSYSVKRTGEKELTLYLPPGYWDEHEKPKPNIFNTADYLGNVFSTPDGLRITLKTNAIGYIQFPLRDRGKLVIDIFPDPIGAKWKPGDQDSQSAAASPAPKAPAQPATPPVPVAQQPATQPQAPATQQATPTAPSSEQAATEPAPAAPSAPTGETASTGKTAPTGKTASVEKPAQEGQTLESLRKEFEEVQKEATPAPQTAQQPQTQAQQPAAQQGSLQQKNHFFSVPYTYRARIQHKGPEEVTTPQKLPEAGQGSSDSGTTPRGADTTSWLDGTIFAPSVVYAAEDTHTVRQSIGNNAAPPVEVEGAQQTQAPQRMEPAAPPQEANNLRARMAPPDTKIPVPVEAPAQRSAPVQVENQEAPPPAPAAVEEAPPQQPGAQEEMAQEQIEQQIDAPEEERLAEDMIEGKPPADTPEAPTQAESAPAQTQEQAPQAASEPAPQAPAPASDVQTTESGEPDPNAPPDFEAVLLQARASLANEEYQPAVDMLAAIKDHSKLPKKMRGDVLYTYADALYALSRQTPRENYAKIQDAYTQAMNDNLESPRVPDALFQLGQLNLKVDSPQQARAYFNILEKRYPDDPHIPLIKYYWGQYYYDHGDFQRAADQFQYIVQKYPDNRYVREASVGLARSLNELGYEEQARELVDYIEKRWPRYYVEFPPLLRLYGDVNYRVGMLDKAKLNYWTYYNMDPNAEGADVVLARLGDIYLELGDVKTAKEVYDMAIEKYPEKEGGLIAKMRLAEQGVYDEPTVQDMFTVFDRPYTERPANVYKMIVEKYPNSELAPLAQLKLAMWYLWNEKLQDALAAADEFGTRFPGSKLTDSAKEVALKAFDKLVSQYLADQNYQGITEMWDKSPLLKSQEGDLAPETRIGLANALWKTGETTAASDMLDPFFKSAAMPRHSENALMLAMSICLDSQNWECLTDLAERTQLWDISPEVKQKMEYNLALAYENLDQSAKSAPLWNNLVDREGIDPAQQAYIQYFLAHEARDNEDYKRAFELAQSSLGIFLDKNTDQEKIKDLLQLLMDVTKTTGRTREALKWAIEYSRYINKNDPEWPALRYQMAQFYRQLADNEKWRAILEELIRDKPNSLYGRMAASELQTRKIEQGARQFTPTAGDI